VKFRLLGRARLQPCRKWLKSQAALAAEGCLLTPSKLFSASSNPGINLPPLFSYARGQHGLFADHYHRSRKRRGKPSIRGLRITVSDVLDYLASGMSHEQILHDFPYLTEEDIGACLAFAADRERKLA